MRDEACAGESAPTRPGGPADDDSVTTEGGTRPARGSARQRARAIEPTMTPRQPQEEVLPALDSARLRGAAPASAPGRSSRR